MTIQLALAGWTTLEEVMEFNNSIFAEKKICASNESSLETSCMI